LGRRFDGTNSNFIRHTAARKNKNKKRPQIVFFFFPLLKSLKQKIIKHPDQKENQTTFFFGCGGIMMKGTTVTLSPIDILMREK
jgi:hypothetical protein